VHLFSIIFSTARPPGNCEKRKGIHMADKDKSKKGVAFVVFGITGDLTRRKLVPALYELMLTNRLPSTIYIIGFARRDWSDEFFQETLHQALLDYARSQPIQEGVAQQLKEGARYIRSTFDEPQGYQVLAKLLSEIPISNVLYYLATPPDAYHSIIAQIGKAGINQREDGWVRIVIEKPYGADLNSAEELEDEVHRVFKEKQVYRIDHYLGKETVQNILVLRFANGIFEPLWDRRYVDHVQITVAETNGVGTRGGYYDTAGVIRDMFQNHLLQLLTLTAMEAPVAFNPDAVRDEKVKVLRALRPMKGMDAVNHTYRAQYTSGESNGKRVPGYKDEANVSGQSITETYLAARVFVDNWRWAGVPFYLRSGKRLPARVTEIAIQFKQAPLSLFNWQNMAGEAPNALILNLQPNEGVTLTFGAKGPGPTNHILPVKMEFRYQETFGIEPPEAYERLLLDCLMGDATLFTRSDEVQAQWGFTTGILEGWKNYPVKNLPVYESGTWGPPGADEFLLADRRKWHNEIEPE
jgi:glucose-6-phosphate 1-dehydrogenase